MKKRKKPRRRAEAASSTVPVGRHPARIYAEVRVNGVRLWTLFDSGAKGNYVARQPAQPLHPQALVKPVRRALGGRVFKVTQGCHLVGSVEGYGIATSALVVGRLFNDETGRPIDAIVGMESMETWGIGLDVLNKRLDFSRYAKESVEG